MALRVLLALALLAAPAAALSGGESSDESAAASAANWLELRAQSLEALKQPQQDELEEVKSSDPGAYAAVKALLAKQALGILNPRRPSAGFADDGARLSSEGAASLARLESEVVKKVPPQEAEAEAPRLLQSPYAEAGASRHDWSHFKPEDTDDQIVASLGGDGSLLSEASQVMSEVVPDDPAPLAPSANVGGMWIPKIDWGSAGDGVHRAPKRAPAAVARAEAPRPQPAMSQQSSWVSQSSIDFGSLIPEAEKAQAPRPRAAMAQADSEFAGFDLKDDLVRRAPRRAQRATPAAQPAPRVVNALTEFDFNTARGDEPVSTETNVYLKAADIHASAVKAVPDHVNPYLTMMGEEDKTDASLLSNGAEVSSPRAAFLGQRGPSNGYLRAINFQNARETRGVLGTFEADLEG